METLKMPARTSSLERLISFALERAVRFGASRQLLQDMELALEEVLTNVSSYAYSDVEDPEVELGFSAEFSGELRFRITDRGAPFNPLEAAPPDLEIDPSERSIGGLGIYLVRKLAHEVLYERSADANHLTLIFRLDPN